MAFKRALWHSGLTYRQTCSTCKTTVEYTDYSLDFRPWYADGFVYCPKCQTPLRHNETYAINAEQNESSVMQAPVNAPAPQESSEPGTAAFCTQCGKKFNEGDRFCSGCGAKRG